MITGQRPGWYHGWNVVAACIACSIVASALTVNCFTLFVVGWANEMHTSVSSLQLALVAMTPLGAISSPLIGALADRYPARGLYAIGIVLLTALYAGMSFATAPWMIIALYGTLAPVMLGLCTAVVSNALIARWFVYRRGLALGLSSFGLGLGGIILPPIIAALLPFMSWQSIWRFAAAFAFVVLLPLVLLVLRNHPDARDDPRYMSPDASSAPVADEATAALGFRDFIRRRTFWIATAAFMAAIGLHGAAQMNLGPYAVSRGLGVEAGGTLLAVLSLTQVGAALVMGLLSDRFGNRLPLMGLLVVVAAGAVLLALAHQLSIALVGAALIGTAYGVYPVITAALAEEFGPQAVGRAFGLIMLFLPVIAPTAYGLAKIQETTGSYTPAFVAFAAIVLIVSALCLLLPVRRLSVPSTLDVAAVHPG